MEVRWWTRVEELFEALADRPTAEREDLLVELCGSDAGLMEEVRSLLAADRRGAAMMPEPAAPAPELPRGRRLGPYRVLRRLGSGGTGTVYLAERDDDAFGRAVAVKVVAEGAAPAPTVARFLAERRILAALDHPNVVRLLDAGGTADGLHYSVMEFVEGEPIDRYCDHRRLAVADRLRLVQAVCSGVHAAHQLLVVHRDIKPANVLVTEGGQPKLLDFGIAKPLPAAWQEADGASAGGPWPMTPEYASPEQVRGWRVGTASDVFALGGLLYHLLTGRSPWRPQRPGVGALAQAICEQAPEPPSAVALEGPDAEARARLRSTTPARLRRRLAGDLDAIVLKALHKEPRHRYTSVDALAVDLGRHLQRRPVRARPGSVASRAYKLWRRNRVAVTAAFAALALLVTITAALAVQAARLASERDRAAVERDKAQRVAAFLGEIFQLADPETSASETVTARQVLDRAAERIPVEFDDRPEVQAELLNTLGRVYADLGSYQRGRELVRRALEARRSALGPDDPAVAESLDRLGQIRSLEGDYAGSERLHRQALDLLLRTVGPDDRRVAGALQNLGVALRRQNRLDEAESVYRRALETYRRVGAEEDPEVARTLSNLAVLLHSRGDLAQAERLHRQALALRLQLLGPGHPDVARSLSYLGLTLLRRGALEEAEASLRRALELHTALWGESHPEVGWAHQDLAMLLRERGDLAGAEEHLRRALDIQRRRLGEDHPDFAQTTNDLALLLIERGELAGARELLARVLETYRTALGPDHPNVGIVLMNLGRVAGLAGDRQQAEERFRQALSILERAPGSEYPEGTAALRLGTLLLDAGDVERAEPELRRAVAVLGRAPSAEPGSRDWAENTLGACLAALGRYPEAERALLATYPALHQGAGRHGEREAAAVERLAALYRAWGRPADAAEWEARRAALAAAGR
jgi:eukaryotic-like serine/threonine-protein kinase